MGTDGSANWTQQQRCTEKALAALATRSGLLTFSDRSAFIRPTTEQANIVHHLGELMLRPGAVVVSAEELGQVARTRELAICLIGRVICSITANFVTKKHKL
ncbi:hypothetical protein [Oceanicoccus sp. KOV_DT_Chl]|uniref:hypothetical protein n=1 Tax=Oceanicoccus sp. KOV_DT_Chl TaxID=1904639 RepID=UPI000C7AAC74|nr:hypothetical protein [Oceanicoccus sp. KOV_DT_Chl]